MKDNLLNLDYGINFRFKDGRGKWEEGEFPRQLPVSYCCCSVDLCTVLVFTSFVFHGLFSEICLDLLLKSIPPNMLVHCDWQRVNILLFMYIVYACIYVGPQYSSSIFSEHMYLLCFNYNDRKGVRLVTKSIHFDFNKAFDFCLIHLLNR